MAFQSCTGAELPAPITASDATCPVANASSGVAHAAKAAAIACCARWAAIAASCASICFVADWFVDISAAACCLLISQFAFLSICFWSSYSVQRSVLCLVRCSVRSRACFPLSGSRRSIRSSISGVRGIGPLPLLSLELEAPDAVPPLSMPELSASLTTSKRPHAPKPGFFPTGPVHSRTTKPTSLLADPAGRSHRYMSCRSN